MRLVEMLCAKGYEVKDIGSQSKVTLKERGPRLCGSHGQGDEGVHWPFIGYYYGLRHRAGREGSTFERAPWSALFADDWRSKCRRTQRDIKRCGLLRLLSIACVEPQV